MQATPKPRIAHLPQDPRLVAIIPVTNHGKSPSDPTKHSFRAQIEGYLPGLGNARFPVTDFFKPEDLETAVSHLSSKGVLTHKEYIFVQAAQQALEQFTPPN